MFIFCYSKEDKCDQKGLNVDKCERLNKLFKTLKQISFISFINCIFAPE